jgi:hypothetical protein
MVDMCGCIIMPSCVFRGSYVTGTKAEREIYIQTSCALVTAAASRLKQLNTFYTDPLACLCEIWRLRRSPSMYYRTNCISNAEYLQFASRKYDIHNIP